MTKVFCAIDTQDLSQAIDLVTKLKGAVSGFKLGLEFFTAHGPAGIAKIRETVGGDVEIFLDLKLHDIPNTVAGAVRAAAQCQAQFLTLHASGGKNMLQAAAQAAQGMPSAPKLLAVTVLTHMDDNDLFAVGQINSMREQVSRLAHLALSCGMHGIVCSPQEISLLRNELPPEFLLVVPGIRLADEAKNDQKRTLTPREAADLGADYLVIGRSITQALDPASAARDIVSGLGLSSRASCKIA